MSSGSKIGNLFRDGWETSAREIYRRARLSKPGVCIYVKPTGVVVGIGARAPDQFHPSDADLIGTYAEGIEIEVVENDLIQYLRGLTEQQIAGRRAA